MSIKKMITKLNKIIIISLIILVSFTNYIKAAGTLTVDQTFLTNLFERYISSEYFARNGGSITGDQTAESMAEDTYNVYGAWIESRYNELYSSSSETDEVTKSENALSQALSEAGLPMAYAAGVDDMIQLADINNAINNPDNGNETTEEPQEPIQTDSSLVVDKEYLKDLFYNYLVGEGGMSAANAEQIANNAAEQYGDEIAREYAEAYNASTITDEEERSQDALNQALSSVLGDDFATLRDNAEDVASTEVDDSNESEGSLGGSIINGIAGVFFYALKLIPMLIGWLLMRIMGFAIGGVNGIQDGFPLDKILFNDIPLLGINFFEQVDASAQSANMINALRDQISIWYVAIRNLAAIILGIMVLYVGIRMAISSVAEEKARYKRMLGDWVVSLVLLFVLHYIMIFIININDSLVGVLANARDTTTNGATIMSEAWDGAMGLNAETVFSFTRQLGYMIIYFMLAVMAFIFFATYVKRMITIAFLIMISPIITITYSLDRMGDGKSQALNTWFKNFVYNILLQPFHCIIYLALVQTALNTMSTGNISSVIVAIIMVFFMYQAEDIVKDIFHFEGKSVATTIAQAALVTSAVGLVSKAASGGSKVRGYMGRRKPSPQDNTNQDNNQTGNAGASGGASSAGGTNPKTKPPATSSNPWEDFANDEDNQMGTYTGNQTGNNTGNNARNNAGNSAGNSARNSARNSAGNNTGNNSQPNFRASRNGGGQQPQPQTSPARGALRTIAGIGKKAGVAALKGGARLAGGAALGAAGLATGNLANAISGYSTGSSLVGDTIDRMEESSSLRKFAKNYNNIVGSDGQNIYRDSGMDNNEIREHVKDMLNGDVKVEEYERGFYDVITKERDRYISQGLSADDAVTQVEQNVAGVQGGYIRETGVTRKFTGKIKNRFKNKKQSK